LSDFNENLIFSTDFPKITKSKFTEIRLGGTKLLHVEGLTDGHDEADSRFSQFRERA
jgi:hypothetical protein